MAVKFKLGTYKVKCDRTGGTFRSDQCQTTWDNLEVYKDFYYPRSPQDSIIAARENQNATNARGTDNLAILPLGDFNNDFNNDFFE